MIQRPWGSECMSGGRKQGMLRAPINRTAHDQGVQMKHFDVYNVPQGLGRVKQGGHGIWSWINLLLVTIAVALVIVVTITVALAITAQQSKGEEGCCNVLIYSEVREEMEQAWNMQATSKPVKTLYAVHCQNLTNWINGSKQGQEVLHLVWLSSAYIPSATNIVQHRKHRWRIWWVVTSAWWKGI